MAEGEGPKKTERVTFSLPEDAGHLLNNAVFCVESVYRLADAVTVLVKKHTELVDLKLEAEKEARKAKVVQSNVLKGIDQRLRNVENAVKSNVQKSEDVQKPWRDDKNKPHHHKSNTQRDSKDPSAQNAAPTTRPQHAKREEAEVSQVNGGAVQKEVVAEPKFSNTSLKDKIQKFAGSAG